MNKIKMNLVMLNNLFEKCSQIVKLAFLIKYYEYLQNI